MTDFNLTRFKGSKYKYNLMNECFMENGEAMSIQKVLLRLNELDEENNRLKNKLKIFLNLIENSYNLIKDVK